MHLFRAKNKLSTRERGARNKLQHTTVLFPPIRNTKSRPASTDSGLSLLLESATLFSYFQKAAPEDALVSHILNEATPGGIQSNAVQCPRVHEDNKL